VASLLKIPEKNVRVIYRDGSGSYGRLSSDDSPEDAALLSRAVGAPVRIQWSRHDEHGWEPKGPAQTQTLRAGIDDTGKIIAWEFTDYSFPWTVASATTLLASEQIGKDLWHQVYHIEFTKKSGDTIDAIAIHDASTEECSMTGVEVFLISRHLGEK